MSDKKKEEHAQGFRLWYRELRQKIRALSPYMRRKRHRRMMKVLEDQIEVERAKTREVAKCFLNLPSFAAAAKITTRVPLIVNPCDELCLFVSYAAASDLKQHVVDHIEALLADGVTVVLIVNTDLDHATIRVPDELAARLSGCIVRQNLGFDFAAWAHAYSMFDTSKIAKRLYLVNDSIVGPLDRERFGKLLARVRASRGDLIGLTANPDPVDHLQSYFLVVSGRLMHAEAFRQFMAGVLNLRDKQDVIDYYEVGLSPYLESRGFQCEALFPALSTERYHRNDTIHKWNKLIECGFPFVKAEVLRGTYDRAEAQRLVPGKYLSG